MTHSIKTQGHGDIIKTMKKNKKQILFTLTIVILAFVFKVNSASAANFAFTVPSSLKVGDNLDVAVTADTGGVFINSAEATVNYDTTLLSFNGYSDSSSVIKIWINPPSAENGQITFSGIIPGGVDGLYDASKTGLSPFPLVHLIFTAKNTGTANFSFANSQILEDDGAGTALVHDNIPASVTIQTNPNGTSVQNPSNNSAENVTNNNAKNPGAMPDRPDPLFWVVIFLLISSLLIYKLLKYKV